MRGKASEDLEQTGEGYNGDIVEDIELNNIEADGGLLIVSST